MINLSRPDCSSPNNSKNSFFSSSDSNSAISASICAQTTTTSAFSDAANSLTLWTYSLFSPSSAKSSSQTFVA